MWSRVCSLGLLICAARIHVSRTSCSAGSVFEGQATSVACQFSEDIVRNKRSVSIFRYDFKGLRYFPEVVMEHTWHAHRNHHNCRTAKGYECDGEVSDTVTITIPHARQHHSGRYKCDYADAEPSHEDGCDLHVRGREISCTGATVYEGEPASVTCHYNSDLSITFDDFYVARLRPHHNHYSDVLTCIWPATGPRLICGNRPHFTFLEDEVSHTVTLHIPAANHSHVGRYYCDTAPTRREVARPVCYVEVKAKKAPALSTSTKSITTTTTTTKTTTGVLPAPNNPQRHVRRHSTDGSSSLTNGHAQTVVVNLLVVFVTQLFLYFSV